MSFKELPSERLDGSFACKIKQEDGTEGCGSSDAMSIYKRGEDKYDAHCFSCGLNNKGFLKEETVEEWTQSFQGGNKNGFKKKKGSGVVLMGGVEVNNGLEKPAQGTYKYLEDRKIKQSVCEFYGVKCRSNELDETKQHLYPYYSPEGKLIGVKKRICASKDFAWEPLVEGNKMSDAILFGQQLFKPGGKYIMVTEGELDALAAFQLQGEKWPVVSLKSGTESVKAILKKNKSIHDFLESFNEIVICFDNDDPGKKAARELAEIFPHKSKIVNFDPGFKDACDYLKDGQTVAFVDAFWRAQKYVPASLVLSSALQEAVISGEAVKNAVDFPYTKVDDMIFGIRKGELITITAGSGVGKSAFVREVAMHLWKRTESNIGMMMLEENNSKTAMGLVGIHLNKPLMLIDLDKQRPVGKRLLTSVNCDNESRADATREVLGTDRFVLYNHFGSNDIALIVSKVKQMHKVFDCQYIFLDHISIVVSGNEDGDERKSLDLIMTQLRMLVEETGITLFLVSHLRRPSGLGHERGAQVSLSDLRGSAGIAQLSDIVLGLERDQQHDNPAMRNITSVRVLKSRMTGLVGPASFLQYDINSGRLNEIAEEEIEAMEMTDKADKAFSKAKNKDNEELT